MVEKLKMADREYFKSAMRGETRVSQVKSSSDELARLAGQLSEMVGRFKV